MVFSAKAESRLKRDFRELVQRVTRALRRHWLPVAILTFWWLTHRISTYPRGYLLPLDREIWVVQVGTWLRLAIQAAVFAIAAVAAASVAERAFMKALAGSKPDGSQIAAVAVEASPHGGGPYPWVRNVLGLVMVFAPLIACLAAGCAHASLWLDELLYWQFEQSFTLRALEWGRPGSRIAGFFTNFFYCDIQRAFHAVTRILGLTLWSDPELFLRCLSLLAFGAIVVVLYFWVLRDSRSWWWPVAATLAFSGSPLFLFYAFEARVYAFASLLVVVDLILLRRALRTPANRGLLIAGALFGVFLVHLHAWVICLFMGIFIAGVVRFFYSRRRDEAIVFACFTVPAGFAGAAETEAILFTRPHGGNAFPLFLPHSFGVYLERTVGGAFSASSYVPLRPAPWLPIPILLLAGALILVAIELRHSALVVFPIGSVLGLVASLEIGSRMGFLISPRYQVPVFAAVFFALAFARSMFARGAVIAFAVIELSSLMSVTIPDIQGKGNGKEVSALIESATPRGRTAVIVQHELRLGYPDPLQTFTLQFYLDGLHPDERPYPILELPMLEDITSVRGTHRYFGGGPNLKLKYASTPREAWREWLEGCPYDRIWFVAAEPAIGLERKQLEAFLAAMRSGPFGEDRRRGSNFTGNPTTRVWLFTRKTS
jgi:hypothetical protein